MPCPYKMLTTTLKIASLTALTLLTSSTLTTTLTTLPTLLALPSLPTAHTALRTLRTRTASLHTSLSRISLGAGLAAFVLGPRARRHPYLLWMTLPVIGVWGAEWMGWLGTEEVKERRNEGVIGLEEERGEVNGEVVREEVETWKRGLGLRGAAWGLGSVVGLVGVWGDGVRR